MDPSVSSGRVRLVAAALAVSVLGFGPGCKERQVSPMDLQAMKKEELKERQGTLTAEEELRILGIQARTRSEFDREVERILEARSKEGTVKG